MILQAQPGDAAGQPVAGPAGYASDPRRRGECRRRPDPVLLAPQRGLV